MGTEELKQNIVMAINASPDKDVIKSVSLFGSFLHGDYNEESDVDLLVNFHRPVGFFTLIGVQEELESRLGRKIDLVTPKFLSRHFRDRVVEEAEKVYGD